MAAKLYDESRSMYEELQGADHPSTLTLSTNLGVLLRTIAEKSRGVEKADFLDSSRRCLERVVAARRRVSHPNDPNTMLCVIQLAATLRQQVARRARVPPSLARVVIGVYVRVCMCTCVCVGGCACVCGACVRAALQKQIVDAENMLMDVIKEIRSKLGVCRRARSRCRCILAARRRVLLSAGDKHPHLGLALNNLGVLLKGTGEFDRAERCYREALAIRSAYVSRTRDLLDRASVHCYRHLSLLSFTGL